MRDRLAKFRAEMKSEKLDAFLIGSPANRFYLSGFTGSAGTLLIGTDKAFLFVDFRYSAQAREEAPCFESCLYKNDLWAAVSDRITDRGYKNVGFEAKQVTFAGREEMQEKIAADLFPLGDLPEKQRAVKNKEEIDLLKRGAGELDRGYEYILGCIRPGMAEKELALELEIFLRRRGAEKAAFPYIVASGLRGAMPHGVASDKLITEGELVTVDFGAVYSGYATDMTRTFAVGSANRKQRQVYNLVNEARQIAAEGIKPGMTGREADALARSHLEKAGYGEYFGHGLGHGVGLETHELPQLSPRSEAVLEEGMIVTIEPGVYIPGWGGVRLEDMALIRKDGVELLTGSPLELMII